MEVLVKMASGREIRLAVLAATPEGKDPDSIVESVTLTVQARKFCCTGDLPEQTFTFRPGFCLDEGRTVAYYALSSGSELNIYYPLNLFARLEPGSDAIPIEMDPNSTVGYLKSRLLDFWPEQDNRLAIDGSAEPLDTMLLSSISNIRNGAVVHLLRPINEVIVLENSKRHILAATLDTTGAELGAEMKRKTNKTEIPTRCFYAGAEIKENETLLMHKMLDKGIIHFNPNSPLFVKTHTGKTIYINLELDLAGSTVADVKAEIQAKEGIPVDQQRILFGGRQLQDEKSLAEYGVEKESTMHLVLRFRGC